MVIAAGSSQSPGSLALGNGRHIGQKLLKTSFAKHEPIDGGVADPPYYILADAVALVGAKLVMEVVTFARGGHFGHQFRRPPM